jgi:hypothetical protein
VAKHQRADGGEPVTVHGAEFDRPASSTSGAEGPGLMRSEPSRHSTSLGTDQREAS